MGLPMTYGVYTSVLRQFHRKSEEEGLNHGLVQVMLIVDVHTTDQCLVLSNVHAVNQCVTFVTKGLNLWRDGYRPIRGRFRAREVKTDDGRSCGHRGGAPITNPVVAEPYAITIVK